MAGDAIIMALRPAFGVDYDAIMGQLAELRGPDSTLEAMLAAGEARWVTRSGAVDYGGVLERLSDMARACRGHTAAAGGGGGCGSEGRRASMAGAASNRGRDGGGGSGDRGGRRARGLARADNARRRSLGGQESPRARKEPASSVVRVAGGVRQRLCKRCRVYISYKNYSHHVTVRSPRRSRNVF